MQLEGERAAVGKRENGAVFQMRRAVALNPWTFNARGATVLDEEVAGLQMDVEWTLPLRAKRKTSSMHSLNRRSQVVRLGLSSRFGDSTRRAASLSRYAPCVLWTSTSVARQSSWMVTAAARRPNPTRQAAGPPRAGLGGFAPPRHVRV